MFSLAAPATAAPPGQLWLVAGALVWPLGAWVVTAARGVTGTARSRSFARTAAVAVVAAVVLFAAAALLFTTNGSARGFQALGLQLASGVSLIGALLSGVIALVLRATADDAERSQQRR